MFEYFTEKAIRTIMLAQEEARRLDRSYVGSEHILLGIIGLGTGPARALRRSGVTLSGARVEAEKITGRGSHENPIEIPFTPNAKRILEQSWTIARRQGVNYIAPEHLLLGLLEGVQGTGFRTLLNLGVDIDKLKADLQALVDYQSCEYVVSDFPGFLELIGKLFGIKKRGCPLSEAANSVITEAQHIAAEFGYPLAGTEFLLFAITNSPSAGSEVLRTAGVTADRVSDAIKSRTPLQFFPVADRKIQSEELSGRSARVVNNARKLAKLKRLHNVSVEELLLALLQEPAGMAWEILHELEADYDRLRKVLNHGS